MPDVGNRAGVTANFLGNVAWSLMQTSKEGEQNCSDEQNPQVWISNEKPKLCEPPDLRLVLD